MTVTAPAWPTLEDVAEEIRHAVSGEKTIGCLAHKDADADSLGSALGFALSMRAMGKTVHVMVPAPVPKLLSYLPGFDTIETAPVTTDVLFTFDCATLGRFGELREFVQQAPYSVNVDHHVSNEGFGTVNLVDAAASATGQVVYRLLLMLGAPISAGVANNLYAALFTDTGGFRHENTTEAALRLGAELVLLGADPALIALKSYKSRSIPQVRLEGLAIAQMTAELDGQLVWSEITQLMLDEAGADMQETEGVIDTLQSIDSMKVAILLKENDATAIKISVRTRDPYDATAICKPFGGGGHHRAAGAELNAALPDARAKVLDVARRLIAAHS
jgi:bifunctional oligoribonuclease and PAP phosphatase NrnA